MSFADGAGSADMHTQASCNVLGLLRDFGTAVGSVLGFLGVLWAWYGVNFVLGVGLHSYAGSPCFR